MTMVWQYFYKNERKKIIKIDLEHIIRILIYIKLVA